MASSETQAGGRDGQAPTPAQCYQWHCALIEREVNWIQNRMSWFGASQGLFFAAYGLFFRNLGKEADEALGALAQLVLLVIPLMGLLLSCLIMVGLKAAAKAIAAYNQSWKSQKALFSETVNARFPEIRTDRRVRVYGQLASLGVCALFFLAWLIIFVATAVSLWS